MSYKYKIEQAIDYQSPDSWGNTNVFLVYDHPQFYVEREGYNPKSIWDYSYYINYNENKVKRDLKTNLKKHRKSNLFSITNPEYRETRYSLNEIIHTSNDDQLKSDMLKCVSILDELIEYDENYKYSSYNDYHIFKVYAYIHSDIRLSLESDSYPFICQFDTSTTGYILINKTLYTENQAKNEAQSLIDEWNMCLSNDVWNVIIYNNDTDDFEDSICDIYGYDNAVNCAEEEIKHYNEKYGN